jgi:hypothetical protein
MKCVIDCGKSSEKGYLGIRVRRLPLEAAAGVFYHRRGAVDPELQLTIKRTRDSVKEIEQQLVCAEIEHTPGICFRLVLFYLDFVEHVVDNQRLATVV